MAYLVELTARAVRDLEILYMEKDVAESQAAARWYNGLESAILKLATHPYRSPVAPEARKMRRELRHLIYGKSPHRYRVIYQVDEQRQTVWVLHIRHGARKSIKRSDLD